MLVRPPSPQRAFTLLEVLLTIGIISLLLALGTPAVQSLVISQGVGKNAAEIAGILELAKSEAIARKTFVWVGFKSEQTHGNTHLIAAIVLSKDGSSSSAPSNLSPIGNISKMEDAMLVPFSNLKSQTRELQNGTPPVSVAENSQGIEFVAGATKFEEMTLTFTPRGEAMLLGAVKQDDGFDPRIDVSFRQATGTATRVDAQEASVLVEGSTGSVKIVRIR